MTNNFHVNRDINRDNLTVSDKIRLPTGSKISSQQMYATADISEGDAIVSMPFTGDLNIQVIGSGNDVIINNPFIFIDVVGNSVPPVVISSGSPGSVSTTNLGQITLTGAITGKYIVSVGTN